MNDSPDVFALAKGLRVLVTAGASGIGRAISDLLALCGARVRICDVSDGFLANYRATHRDSSLTKTDLASEADVARLFADVTASLGGLDALINNAGMAGPTGGVEDIALADWRRTIDLCLIGQFLAPTMAYPC
jgi:NAD(P)-dependent dehydrogenase (short-subunit alcohol dehydrogenase family)